MPTLCVLSVLCDKGKGINSYVVCSTVYPWMERTKRWTVTLFMSSSSCSRTSQQMSGPTQLVQS